MFVDGCDMLMEICTECCVSVKQATHLDFLARHCEKARHDDKIFITAQYGTVCVCDVARHVHACTLHVRGATWECVSVCSCVEEIKQQEGDGQAHVRLARKGA
jgi:hypothetical protein